MGLWAMLWLSLQATNITSFLNPSSPLAFFNGIRAILPFAAGFSAMILMLANLSQQRPRGFRFFGPLGLMVVYGLVGIAAATLSPDMSVALHWMILYLSVPLVLWAVVWGTDPLGRIGFIIKFNWFLILFGFAVLFVYTLIYLDLSPNLSKSWTLLQCDRAGSWFVSTGGNIRSTGVGRFAAIAAIISFSLLWQSKRWRLVWIAVLYLSLVLLLSTAARTSIIGIAAAIPLIAVLQGGRKVVIAAILALAVLAPAAWAVGVPQTFLQTCILRSYDPAGIDYLNIQSPPAAEPDPGSATAAKPPPASSGTQDSPGPGVLTPDPPGLDGSAVLPAIDGEGRANSGSSNVAEIPTQDGKIVVEPAPGIPESTAKQTTPPVRKTDSKPGPDFLPPGFLALSGRTIVWTKGWAFIKLSPFLGYGFHGDRLVLGTHLHNSVLHAMMQTGLAGTIPFAGALLYGWLLLFKGVKTLGRIPAVQKQIMIPTAGILVFLSIRSIFESVGAFFGIDWFLLAPLLLYLQILDSNRDLIDEAG